jgi:hypothetical protein
VDELLAAAARDVDRLAELGRREREGGSESDKQGDDDSGGGEGGGGGGVQEAAEGALRPLSTTPGKGQRKKEANRGPSEVSVSPPTVSRVPETRRAWRAEPLGSIGNLKLVEEPLPDGEVKSLERSHCAPAPTALVCCSNVRGELGRGDIAPPPPHLRHSTTTAITILSDSIARSLLQSFGLSP